MTDYPSLIDIITTIGEIAFFFLLGIVLCACLAASIYLMLKKYDPK